MCSDERPRPLSACPLPHLSSATTNHHSEFVTLIDRHHQTPFRVFTVSSVLAFLVHLFLPHSVAMIEPSGSGERAPLLRRSEASSASSSSASKSSHVLPDTESDSRIDKPVTISWSRGTLIVCSIGLLIFLQGTLVITRIIMEKIAGFRRGWSDPNPSERIVCNEDL